jgi:hypothetical protein
MANAAKMNAVAARSEGITFRDLEYLQSKFERFQVRIGVATAVF